MWRMRREYRRHWGWGQVHEIVTWLSAMYLADRSTIVQNVSLHLTLAHAYCLQDHKNGFVCE